MTSDKTRTERDTMGEIKVPDWALWGAQTQRALENFSVSPHTIPPATRWALAQIKAASAAANAALGELDGTYAEPIIAAATEIADGEYSEHFPVDVFQTGSGTSWNMNMNEVIAKRANGILGDSDDRVAIHPNDHVNRGQSSNCVIPSAISLANRRSTATLLATLRQCRDTCARKAEAFDDIVKLGRTHLQDAVPMTLGQTFNAFATQLTLAERRIEAVMTELESLPLGGTAVGTGLNAHPKFAATAVAELANRVDLPLRPATDPFAAIAARDEQVALMGTLNGLCVALMKIGNDLRLLASGPRAGLGEIQLPKLQPGSSIMPGKVNPVIPEMVIQVAAHVLGKCHSVSIGGQHAPLELNIMQPLIAHETESALALLQNTLATLSARCIAGIEADRKRCRDWIEWSSALVTPLALHIGYERAAELAVEAYESGRKIRDVVIEHEILSPQACDEILDPERLAHPHRDTNH